MGLLYQEEISQCQQILLFLQRYLSQAANEKEEECQEETCDVEEIDGMKVVAKKQSVHQAQKKNKKKKEKPEKSTGDRVTLSLGILQEMYKLKITPPVKLENI